MKCGPHIKKLPTPAIGPKHIFLIPSKAELVYINKHFVAKLGTAGIF
jgi:hypothetical protein